MYICFKSYGDIKWNFIKWVKLASGGVSTRAIMVSFHSAKSTWVTTSVTKSTGLTK